MFKFVKAICAWCVQPVPPESPHASRLADGEMWHVECFMKHLAHKDELAGIVREHSLHAAKPLALYCPRCLGPMVREVKIEQHEDGSPLIETEVFECAAGCETSPPEPQERA